MSDEAREIAELAATDFEAIQIDLAGLPTAETIQNPTLVCVRLAAVTLGKTKADLITTIAALDDEALQEAIEGMEAAHRELTDLASMIQAALVRTQIAILAGEG